MMIFEEEIKINSEHVEWAKKAIPDFETLKPQKKNAYCIAAKFAGSEKKLKEVYERVKDKAQIGPLEGRNSAHIRIVTGVALALHPSPDNLLGFL